MKLRFNGVLETVSGGCIPCGAKRVSSQSVVTSKFYTLPSGAQKTFYVGRVEEVSEEDGAFLLQYIYTDKNGNTRNVFERVD